MNSPKIRPRALPILAAIVCAGLALAALVAAWNASHEPTTPQAQAAPTPTPAPSPPPVGKLTPERVTQTDLENTPEARALRTATAVMAWAGLQMRCDIPEIKEWLHPDLLADGQFCSDVTWGPGDGVAQAGPYAYEIVEITHNDDGTVDIITCAIAQPLTRYRVDTHEPAFRGVDGHILSRARLVRHGDTYQYLEGDSTSLGKCEPTSTITTQHFVDWQDTPRFTRYYTGDET